MVTHKHKDALYEQLARLGKAVAAPRRLELLDLVGQAPRTVDGLAEQTGMSITRRSISKSSAPPVSWTPKRTACS